MDLRLFFLLGFFPEYLPAGLAFGVVIGIYVFFRLRSFLRSFGLDPKKKKWRIVRLIMALIPFGFCFNPWSNAMAVALYIFVSGILADIIALIVRVIRRKKPGNLYYRGGLTFILFLILFAHGYFTMNHIVRTEYRYETDKVTKPYRILFLSDLHYDTVQSPKVLKKTIQKMNALNADIVLLGGDITDERTSKDSMREVFEVLGQLTSTYGSFYVYGNHDRQPYEIDYKDGVRTYTDEELKAAILENGIRVLEDESVVIDDAICIVGRADAGWYGNNRKTAQELLPENASDHLMFMYDHQPIEYEECAELGYDLGIAGHTHGGQLWPMPFMLEALGYLIYGEYHFGDYTLIVSSGFTGWGWPVRNAYYSEYVVVDVVPM